MTEFWESSFKDKQAMWGFEPADSAIYTRDLFAKQELKQILIPGFGYGRNAKAFTDSGMEVTGIEISETAISIAKTHFGEQLKVHHGSVSDMPFDEETYDGIFCYALIHLLDAPSRIKLIRDSFAQLSPGGYMVFVTISKSSPSFGDGTLLEKDTYKTRHGVTLFYYDQYSIHNDFAHYGLIDVQEMSEPNKHSPSSPDQQFWIITCQKE